LTDEKDRRGTKRRRENIEIEKRSDKDGEETNKKRKIDKEQETDRLREKSKVSK